MKVFISTIFTMLVMTIFPQAKSSTVAYLWENISIQIPVHDSLDNYKHLPNCSVYVSNVKQDVEINYWLDYRYFTENTVTTHKVGIYYLDYVAEIPTYNYSSEQRVRFEVVDRTAPVIKTSDQIIVLDEVINLNNYISITDNHDKLNELNVTIDQRGFTNKKVGVYEIKITAIDSSLNKSNEILRVEVIDEDAPFITSKEVSVKIPYGTINFFPSLYYEAYDNYDQYISQNIVLENEINFQQLGEQPIVLSVRDSSNLFYQYVGMVTIVDEEKPTITLSEHFIQIDNIMNINDDFLRDFIFLVSDNESDLTKDDVFIDYSKILALAGIYTVSYIVTDFSKNEDVAILQVNIVNSLRIDVSVSNIEIFIGETFDYVDYITINQIDGLKYYISLLENNVNINKSGNYYIDVAIYDSLNNLEEQRIIVKVLPGQYEGNDSSSDSSRSSFDFNKNDIYVILGLVLAALYILLKKNRK